MRGRAWVRALDGSEVAFCAVAGDEAAFYAQGSERARKSVVNRIIDHLWALGGERRGMEEGEGIGPIAPVVNDTPARGASDTFAGQRLSEVPTVVFDGLPPLRKTKSDGRLSPAVDPDRSRFPRLSGFEHPQVESHIGGRVGIGAGEVA